MSDLFQISSKNERTVSIYAHWEGFIKAASNAYLMYIVSQRLKYAELTNNFFAIAAKKLLNDLSVSDRVTSHVQVTGFFLSGLTDRCSYLAEIETKSNLSSEVLKEIIYILGLDYKEYETKANLIDETGRATLRGETSGGREKSSVQRQTVAYANTHHRVNGHVKALVPQGDLFCTRENGRGHDEHP